ncbi:hypothetical protein pb186bvf_001644 [Paramecium bursaria]
MSDKLVTPRTSDKCLIVPQLTNKMGFKLYDGIPSTFDISQAAVENCIFQCNKVCQQIRCEHYQIEYKNNLTFEESMVTITWIMHLIGILFLGLGMGIAQHRERFMYLGLGIILFTIVVSLVTTLLGITKSQKFMIQKDERIKRLTELLEHQNAYFLNKGLKWSIGSKCLWLQLDKI